MSRNRETRVDASVTKTPMKSSDFVDNRALAVAIDTALKAGIDEHQNKGGSKMSFRKNHRKILPPLNMSCLKKDQARGIEVDYRPPLNFDRDHVHFEDGDHAKTEESMSNQDKDTLQSTSQHMSTSHQNSPFQRPRARTRRDRHMKSMTTSNAALYAGIETSLRHSITSVVHPIHGDCTSAQLQSSGGRRKPSADKEEERKLRERIAQKLAANQASKPTSTLASVKSNQTATDKIRRCSSRSDQTATQQHSYQSNVSDNTQYMTPTTFAIEKFEQRLKKKLSVETAPDAKYVPKGSVRSLDGSENDTALPLDASNASTDGIDCSLGHAELRIKAFNDKLSRKLASTIGKPRTGSVGSNSTESKIQSYTDKLCRKLSIASNIGIEKWYEGRISASSRTLDVFEEGLSDFEIEDAAVNIPRFGLEQSMEHLLTTSDAADTATRPVVSKLISWSELDDAIEGGITQSLTKDDSLTRQSTIQKPRHERMPRRRSKSLTSVDFVDDRDFVNSLYTQQRESLRELRGVARRIREQSLRNVNNDHDDELTTDLSVSTRSDDPPPMLCAMEGNETRDIGWSDLDEALEAAKLQSVEMT